MKRILNLMLILAFLVPLAACGKKGELEAPEGYRPSDEIEETEADKAEK